MGLLPSLSGTDECVRNCMEADRMHEDDGLEVMSGLIRFESILSCSSRSISFTFVLARKHIVILSLTICEVLSRASRGEQSKRYEKVGYSPHV